MPKRRVQKKEDREFIQAIFNHHIDVVRTMLQRGVSPNVIDGHGTPALNCALYVEDEKIAWLLLKEGANPDAPDSECVTPIMLASRSGFITVVEFLIGKGVDLAARAKGGIVLQGGNSLWLACSRGHRKIANLLIDAGADANQNVRGGINPLSGAATFGDIALVRDVIAAGGKASEISLFAPVEKGRADIVEALIKAKADVNVRDRWGNTVLGAAVQAGNKKVVRLVIQAGAKLDFISSGRTPLIFAVCKQNIELVDMLLTAGAKVDAKDIYGLTALMEASSHSSEGIVLRLLAVGANPSLRSKGRTSADIAREAGQTKNLAVLNAAMNRAF